MNTLIPNLFSYSIHTYTRTMHSKGRIPWLAIIYPIYSILNSTLNEWKRCSWYSQATTCLTRSHLLGDRVQESMPKTRENLERWPVLFIQKTLGSGVSCQRQEKTYREVTCVAHPKKRYAFLSFISFQRQLAMLCTAFLIWSGGL